MFFLQSAIIHPHIRARSKPGDLMLLPRTSLKTFRAQERPHAVSSICRSCKATHSCHGFSFSPVELFGTHVQIGVGVRVTPPVALPSMHMLTPRHENVYGVSTLLNGCCPLLSKQCLDMPKSEFQTRKKLPALPALVCVCAYLHTWTRGHLRSLIIIPLQ